jgi:hypothetical protein
LKDQSLSKLQKRVRAAQDESDAAVHFHEAWRPIVYDAELRKRMGTSYATNTFNLIRIALRREMLLALTRIWDADGRAIHLKNLIQTANDAEVIRSLANERGLGSWADMERDLRSKASEAQTIANKYFESNGKSRDAYKILLEVRGNFLAHNQIDRRNVPSDDEFDQKVENFYQDTLKIVELLLSVVNATSYNLEDTAKVFRRYSDYFWASARGERTEGHPSYRKPP